MHARENGLVDILADTEEEILRQARRLMDVLPSSWREAPPYLPTGDDPQRCEDVLDRIVPSQSQKPFDMHEVILPVLDNRDFLEMKSSFARNMITGFARLGGRTVGVVANQPKYLGGVIDIKAAEKGARFVRFCDAFNIPIITFQILRLHDRKRDGKGGHDLQRRQIAPCLRRGNRSPGNCHRQKGVCGGVHCHGQPVHRRRFCLCMAGGRNFKCFPKTAASILFRKELADAGDKGDVETLFHYYYDNYVNPGNAASLLHINDIIEPGKRGPF